MGKTNLARFESFTEFNEPCLCINAESTISNKKGAFQFGEMASQTSPCVLRITAMRPTGSGDITKIKQFSEISILGSKGVTQAISKEVTQGSGAQ
ncbi:hypothetical protein T265_12310 [Opisthorchis viverrini]|uniref:Uncharacterized protein n=1 Tax=Opisthorchis viverrini TaxID=6198 RepID=A0A074YYQ1_OPIVI|nr:hypothetical protein T265_12310 [Opisthorchis viverrini]KER18322.1 hypothetical protein T265_12310 [Opisthorchis viverrini]